MPRYRSRAILTWKEIGKFWLRKAKTIIEEKNKIWLQLAENTFKKQFIFANKLNAKGKLINGNANLPISILIELYFYERIKCPKNKIVYRKKLSVIFRSNSVNVSKTTGANFALNDERLKKNNNFKVI